jgi:hypothetical protein
LITCSTVAATGDVAPAVTVTFCASSEYSAPRETTTW